MNDILGYMKAAIEGQAGLLPFARWLHENDAAIQEICSRGSYLRLKHQPLEEFRKILSQFDITFTDSANAYLPRELGDYSWIKAEWLSERLFPYRQSPTDLAAANTVYLDELLHMIDIKITGDELWRFSSPASTWESKCGRAGIALVREGTVIYAIVTAMN